MMSNTVIRSLLDPIRQNCAREHVGCRLIDSQNTIHSPGVEQFTQPYIQKLAQLIIAATNNEGITENALWLIWKDLLEGAIIRLVVFGDDARLGKGQVGAP